MFFSYIIAALVFTALIVRDLLVLAGKKSTARGKHATDPSKLSRWSFGRRASVHAVLSFVSFAVLSYNMLNFLIESYRSWAQSNEVGLPRPNYTLHELMYAVPSLHIWRWSTESTLFQSFAETICREPYHFWWTRQTLLYSIMWNMVMSIEGRSVYTLEAFL